MRYFFALFLVGCLTANAQTIPNLNFENWTTGGPAGDSLNEWTTSERTARTYGSSNSVFRGTDAHNDAFSIHLKNVQVSPFPGINIKGPGVATNGLIDFTLTNGFKFSKGSPDTSRVRSFSYWFKYDNTASAADYGLIRIYKLRYNSGTGNRDTVAAGIDTVRSSSSYAFRSVSFVYRDWVNQPDTTLIILQSAPGLNDPAVGLGDELVLDSISFAGWVGIQDPTNSVKGVRMYPLPANDHLSLDVEVNRSMQLTWAVYDMNGRLVESREMNSLSETIVTSTWPAGRYLLKLTDEHGTGVYAAPVTVTR